MGLTQQHTPQIIWGVIKINEVIQMTEIFVPDYSPLPDSESEENKSTEKEC